MGKQRQQQHARTAKADTTNFTAFLADGHMQAHEGGSWVVHCDDMIAPVHSSSSSRFRASSPVPVRTNGRGWISLAAAAVTRAPQLFVARAAYLWPLGVYVCVYVLCRLFPTLAVLFLCCIPRHHDALSQLRQRVRATAEVPSKPRPLPLLSQPAAAATRDNPSTTARSRVQTSVAEASPYR